MTRAELDGIMPAQLARTRELRRERDTKGALLTWQRIARIIREEAASRTEVNA